MGNKKEPPKLKLVEKVSNDKVNPVMEAERWFMHRLIIKNGAFYLDGYPLNLNGVMRTYNTERQAAGKDQITTKPEWIV